MRILEGDEDFSQFRVDFHFIFSRINLDEIIVRKKLGNFLDPMLLHLDDYRKLIYTMPFTILSEVLKEIINPKRQVKFQTSMRVYGDCSKTILKPYESEILSYRTLINRESTKSVQIFPICA